MPSKSNPKEHRSGCSERGRVEVGLIVLDPIKPSFVREEQIQILFKEYSSESLFPNLDPKDF